MSKFIEVLRLIRFLNCLLAAAGVWIGAYLTWLTPVYFGPTVASLAAFFICAAGNVVNDLVDVRVDAINHPNRVLVIGRLSRKFALRLAVVLNIVALLLAASLSWTLLLIALGTIGLLLAYNLWLKQMIIAGNIAVALLAGMTFLTGGLAVEPGLTFRLPGPLIATTYAFLFHLVREILKDVQDIPGDREAGQNSLALWLGPTKSLLVALAVFVALVVMTYLPILNNWYGRSYEIIAVYVVDLPLLGLLILVWGNPSQRMLAVGSTGLKIGMALGLVALVLG